MTELELQSLVIRTFFEQAREELRQQGGRCILLSLPIPIYSSVAREMEKLTEEKARADKGVIFGVVALFSSPGYVFVQLEAYPASVDHAWFVAQHPYWHSEVVYGSSFAKLGGVGIRAFSVHELAQLLNKELRQALA